MNIHIAIAAEKLGTFFGLEITNSFFTTLIVVTIILTYAYITGSNLKLKNPNKNQLFIEWVVAGLLSFTNQILGKKIGKEYFGIIFSFFVFIIISNWFGLLPFVPAINYTAKAQVHEIEKLIETDSHDIEEEVHETNSSEHSSTVHLFRAPTTDLNTTFALALVSVLLIQFAAIKNLGLPKYTGKYFNFKIKKKGVMGIFEAGIGSFVGILELLSEFTKILSFAFRLFGNIFAGEVLLLVISALTFSVGTLPFLGLEIFVGFIQAFVFMMLTTVFLSVSISDHSH